MQNAAFYPFSIQYLHINQFLLFKFCLLSKGCSNHITLGQNHTFIPPASCSCMHTPVLGLASCSCKALFLRVKEKWSPENWSLENWLQIQKLCLEGGIENCLEGGGESNGEEKEGGGW